MLSLEKHQKENFSLEGFFVNKNSNLVALTSEKRKAFKAKNTLELCFPLDLTVKWLLEVLLDSFIPKGQLLSESFISA